MTQSPNQQIAKFPVNGLGAIVMAAGLGKRMRSKAAKVLHRVAGRAMFLYAVDLARRLASEGVVVVVGHQGDRVKAVLEADVAATVERADLRGYPAREKGLTAHVRQRAGLAPAVFFAEQPEPLGTGHAVMQARRVLLRLRKTPAQAFLVLNGDTPLLQEATLRDLIRLHREEKAAVTMLTARLDEPSGYGRVVRGKDGRVARIVEERDATEGERGIHEVNVGTYVMDGPFLFEALEEIRPRNAQREYYLTDVVGLAVTRGLPVAAYPLAEAEEGVGINSRQQLTEAERLLRQRICARWMDEGVTIRDPQSTLIDADVSIGRDTELHPHVTLEGRTRVGEDCLIRSWTRISDSHLSDGVVVQDCCIIRESQIEQGATIGPFAHLRPGSIVREGARVGNFVEMKQADLGPGSKANHLSYLGDTKIGRGVNIGAGTITCNYDGVRKHLTVIEDGVFVGSDTQLIAPVRIGARALIGAGSTITEDVPADALAIARPPQVNKAGWAVRRRALQVSEGGREVRSSKFEVGERTAGVKPRTSNLKPQTKKAATKKQGGK